MLFSANLKLWDVTSFPVQKAQSPTADSTFDTFKLSRRNRILIRMPRNHVCTCIVTETGRLMCILHTLTCCPQKWHCAYLQAKKKHHHGKACSSEVQWLPGLHYMHLGFRSSRLLWLVCPSKTAQQTSNLWAGLLCQSCTAALWYFIECVHAAELMALFSVHTPELSRHFQ